MYGYEVFHNSIAKNLIDTARSGEIRNAYIFEGAKGIGKKETARLAAAAMCCRNPAAAPCGSCPACIGSKANTNPDIIYVSCRDKKSIGVETIREISADVYIKPFETGRKVYIIEDGDLITEQAQNAFLKILEEPPEYVVFIILVSNVSMLLQTIISRCTVIRFAPLKKDIVKKYIEEKYPDADAEFLSNYAEGNIGKADAAMEKEDFFALRERAFKMLTPLMSRHKISAYRITEFLEENKEDAAFILETWQKMIRDMIFIRCGAKEQLINSDMAEPLGELAWKIPGKTLHIASERLVIASEMQRRYVNLRAMALNLALSIKKAAY